jgi:hypothetical protein
MNILYVDPIDIKSSIAFRIVSFDEQLRITKIVGNC